MSMDSKGWDELFSKREYYFGTLPNDFLREHYARIPKGGEVLCLAEGEGRNAVFLAKMGYRVTAVERSAPGLRKMEVLARQYEVQITSHEADLAYFDFGMKRWDGIVSIWAHLPSAVRRPVHQACVANLNAGGVFLLEDFAPMLKKIELLEELSGLYITHAVETERELNEGVAHVGRNSVVQILGSKPV